VDSFLKRCVLSIRKPPIKRCPEATAEEKAQFVREMKDIMGDGPEGVDEESTFNIDESGWKTFPNHLFMIALRGEDSVAGSRKSGQRESTTVIAGISRSGEKLPMCIVAKGTSEVCERKVGRSLPLSVEEESLKVTHHKSGWCDKNVAMACLEWLREL
jgi:hypothetical protein